jgi:hypothetical protein
MSYSMYDIIITKKVKTWGFVYPFVGVSFRFCVRYRLSRWLQNIVTLTVMLSIVGVLQSVLNNVKLMCLFRCSVL